MLSNPRWTVFVAGFVIEVVSDHQKFEFKAAPKNEWRWCDVGLWLTPYTPRADKHGWKAAATCWR